MSKVMVLAGYGLNCEEETLHAFEHAGLTGVIRHINDLIENPQELNNVQILAVPGGFSYGDDTGSGNAFAQKMKLALWDHLKRFVERDTLTIGICNGCQILTNLGLAPPAGHDYGERLVAVTYNLTEMPDQALDRPGRRIAERADRVAFDLLGHVQQHVDLGLLLARPFTMRSSRATSSRCPRGTACTGRSSHACRNRTAARWPSPRRSTCP
jgi:hypothetical protein